MVSQCWCEDVEGEGVVLKCEVEQEGLKERMDDVGLTRVTTCVFETHDKTCIRIHIQCTYRPLDLYYSHTTV